MQKPPCELVVEPNSQGKKVGFSMDQNQVYNLPPQPEPQPEPTLEQIQMLDDSQGLSKYAIPQRDGYTFGAAGISQEQASSLDQAMTSKRFNRMRIPDENHKEDGMAQLLADEEGRSMTHNQLKKAVTPSEFGMKKTE